MLCLCWSVPVATTESRYKGQVLDHVEVGLLMAFKASNVEGLYSAIFYLGDMSAFCFGLTTT